MKRIILLLIVYLGLVPCIDKKGIKFEINNVCFSQVGAGDIRYKVARYIESQDPNLQATPMNSNSYGVSVRNLSNNSFYFVYANPEWVAANPGFTAYVNNAPPEPPAPPTLEIDQETRYSENYIGHLIDMQKVQERMDEFATWASSAWGENGGGGAETGPADPPTCVHETGGGEGVQESNIPFNNIANATSVNCSNSFLLKNRRIVHFTAAQQALIKQYNFDGSTLVSFVGINDYLYVNATAAEVVKPQKKCSPDWDIVPGPGYISQVYSTYKFIAFQRVNTNASAIGASLDQDTKVWFGIPYSNTDYCIEVPVTLTEAVAAGKVVVGATKYGVLYCETLTAEDATLTTIVKRNEDFKVNSFNLDHFVNVPLWVEKFFFNLGMVPSDCAVEYVNARLAELHASSVYTSQSDENKKKIIEYETLAYDLIFGMLYCASDENAAKNKDAIDQMGLGILHEAIAIIDIKEIINGVAHIANGAVNMVSNDINNIITAAKDVIVQQTTTGSVNYEQIAKKFIEANNSQFISDYEKAKVIANHFTETYFTKCDADPNYGNICPYRHGQVAMMALPIVLTAGDWAVVKATSLINKYAVRTQRAIQLMNEAANASRQTVQEAYIVLDEAESIVSLEKTVIKEIDGTVRASIKQEGEIGNELIVITEAANYIDDAIIAGLSTELPTASGNLSMSKFTNSAHKIDPVVDPVLNQAVQDVMNYGDLSGSITEIIQNRLFADKMGLTPLDGKVASDNGFDGLFIRGTTSNPQKIYITESKQWRQGGGVKLEEYNPITNLPAQMSLDWIEDVALRLQAAGKVEAATIVQNFPWLIERVVITVNKRTGDINLLKLGNY